MKNTLSAIAAITGGLLIAGSVAAFAVSGSATLAKVDAAPTDTVDARPVSTYDVNTVDDYSGEPIATYDDWVEPTAAEIAAQEAESGESVEIWVAQQRLTRDCMLDQGFIYAWNLSSQRDEGRFDFSNYRQSLPTAERAALEHALWGDTMGQYSWQTAGCSGLSVHLTGMDGQS